MAAFSYKVLGQQALTGTTMTDLYTVPASTQAIVQNLVVCNRGSAASTYRVAIRPAGAALANQHYIAFDVAIAANTTHELPGFSLGAADVVTVAPGASSTVTFVATGTEYA